MTWWTQWEYSFENNINIDNINKKLEENKSKIKHDSNEIINYVWAYTITWEKRLSVITWFDYIPNLANSEAEKKELWQKLDKYKNEFRQITIDILKTENNTIKEVNYTNIWKTFWDYIKNTAIFTLIITIIAISIYVSRTFSWVIHWLSVFSFAFITIITLFHDILIATWIYLIISLYFPEYKIDTYFITALLTILWYSINDTIIIFDRIRSNIKKYIKEKNTKTLEEIIDISTNETIRRSIFTSLTVVIILISILLFWPESIRWFTIVILLGTIVWTYSSIFIASPLLYEYNKNKILLEIKNKTINPEDKIVI